MDLFLNQTSRKDEKTPDAVDTGLIDGNLEVRTLLLCAVCLLGCTV
jgi:hypothetical protein